MKQKIEAEKLLQSIQEIQGLIVGLMSEIERKRYEIWKLTKIREELRLNFHEISKDRKS